MFSIKTILYPTDFSPRAEHAFHIAFARSFWTWMELSSTPSRARGALSRLLAEKGARLPQGLTKGPWRR